jgi:hypothetical protein
MVQDHMPDTVLDVLGKVRNFYLFICMIMSERIKVVATNYCNNKHISYLVFKSSKKYYGILSCLLCVIFAWICATISQF